VKLAWLVDSVVNRYPCTTTCMSLPKSKMPYCLHFYGKKIKWQRNCLRKTKERQNVQIRSNGTVTTKPPWFN